MPSPGARSAALPLTWGYLKGAHRWLHLVRQARHDGRRDEVGLGGAEPRGRRASSPARWPFLIPSGTGRGARAKASSWVGDRAQAKASVRERSASRRTGGDASAAMARAAWRASGASSCMEGPGRLVPGASALVLETCGLSGRAAHASFIGSTSGGARQPAQGDEIRAFADRGLCPAASNRGRPDGQEGSPVPGNPCVFTRDPPRVPPRSPPPGEGRTPGCRDELPGRRGPLGGGQPCLSPAEDAHKSLEISVIRDPRANLRLSPIPRVWIVPHPQRPVRRACVPSSRDRRRL